MEILIAVLILASVTAANYFLALDSSYKCVSIEREVE